MGFIWQLDCENLEDHGEWTCDQKGNVPGKGDWWAAGQTQKNDLTPDCLPAGVEVVTQQLHPKMTPATDTSKRFFAVSTLSATCELDFGHLGGGVWSSQKCRQWESPGFGASRWIAVAWIGTSLTVKRALSQARKSHVHYAGVWKCHQQECTMSVTLE